MKSWTSPKSKLLTAMILVALAACSTRGQNRLIPIASGPMEAYDCLLYELAKADFTITDSDRASGFVRALRVDRNFIDGSVRREIHATIIRAPNGSQDLIQISSNAKANEQADSLAGACVP